MFYKINDGLNRLKKLLKEHPYNSLLSQAFDNSKFFQFYRPFMLNQDRKLREYAYESFQKILSISEDVANQAKLAKIHIILSYSLGRDNKSPNLIDEKTQILKCIQVWIIQYPKSFPFILAQSLISICRNYEDKVIHRKSIEILIDISAKCHEVCSYMGGFKLIIDSLINLSAEKIRYDYLISSILNVINTPENRKSFRDCTELTRIFSIFTVAEVNKKQIDDNTLEIMENKYTLAKQVIVQMIRHWTGLLYLAADPTGIKSLVEALTQPIIDLKKVAILDLFIDIFSQKIDNASAKSGEMLPHYKHKIGTLVSNYMSFVLLAFIRSDLYQQLIELILSGCSYKVE